MNILDVIRHEREQIHRECTKKAFDNLGVLLSDVDEILNRIEVFVEAHDAAANIATTPIGGQKTSREITLDEVRIAYMKGERIRFTRTNGTSFTEYWIDGAPKCLSDDGKEWVLLPSITAKGCWAIVSKSNFVDGLAACKAYREGKGVHRPGESPYFNDGTVFPDFTKNDWEILP